MSSDAANADSVQFRPERTNILAAVLMIAIALLAVGAAPLYLFWVLLIPAAFLFWVLRARTTVGERGVDIQYAFRGSRSVGWDRLAGIGFKGSRALLTTKDGRKYPMPGITFNSLPELSEASRGRIPDVLTSAREAADDKVTIIRRDGEQILITKEEYAARQAEREATAGSHNGESENRPAKNNPDNTDTSRSSQ
ncbi:PH domain-containing protein [Corynebacterium comes]|uniref:Low molecular weight protein antigen 6 n=1 Tax=Corynebacterium comes TaxID=2675218 RepID=A0A6B8VGJ1_9CORY|nr:PH domain-containing protein [Corynebacterium comes]QGU04412.1 Low molecular weight protein antigen 6 [Corynebacterium comes]